jgi:hypothetical protein
VLGANPAFYTRPLSGGSIAVARYGAQIPAVVYRSSGRFRTTLLNYLAPSKGIDARSWDPANTPSAQLIANALLFSETPSAAEVTATAPTNITATSVTLRATANPRGGATEVSFYLNGQFVESVSGPAGVAPVEIELPVTGLNGNLNYFMTAYAENSLGGSLGAEGGTISVQTANRPPVAQDDAAVFRGVTVAVPLLAKTAIQMATLLVST